MASMTILVGSTLAAIWCSLDLKWSTLAAVAFVVCGVCSLLASLITKVDGSTLLQSLAYGTICCCLAAHYCFGGGPGSAGMMACCYPGTILLVISQPSSYKPLIMLGVVFLCSLVLAVLEQTVGHQWTPNQGALPKMWYAVFLWININLAGAVNFFVVCMTVMQLRSSQRTLRDSKAKVEELNSRLTTQQERLELEGKIMRRLIAQIFPETVSKNLVHLIEQCASGMDGEVFDNIQMPLEDEVEGVSGPILPIGAVILEGAASKPITDPPQCVSDSGTCSSVGPSLLPPLSSSSSTALPPSSTRSLCESSSFGLSSVCSPSIPASRSTADHGALRASQRHNPTHSSSLTFPYTRSPCRSWSLTLSNVGPVDIPASRSAADAGAIGAFQRRRSQDSTLFRLVNRTLAPKLHFAATILFADLVGFTNQASRVDPSLLVRFLDLYFGLVDGVCTAEKVDKIKTIGDCYMCVGWAEDSEDPITSASTVLTVASKMHSIARQVPLNGSRLFLRAGMHTGTVVSGIIGKTKLAFDVWGDAVNVASRMESTGIPGATQVTADTYELLKDKEVFVERGLVEVKGRGKLQTYTTVESLHTPEDDQIVEPEASNAVQMFYNLLTATEDRPGVQ
jgi:class 3 adenylate cyclase